MLALNPGLYGIQGRLSSIARDAYRFAISNKVAQSAISKINSLCSFLSPATQTRTQRDLRIILLEDCEKMREQVERMSYPCHEEYLSCVKGGLEEIGAHLREAGDDASALKECRNNLNEIAESLKEYKSLATNLRLTNIGKFSNLTVALLLPLLFCFLASTAGWAIVLAGCAVIFAVIGPPACFLTALYVDLMQRDIAEQRLIVSRGIALNWTKAGTV